MAQLLTVAKKCSRGLVGKQDAYSAILSLMIAYAESAPVAVACLRALTSLMTKQPDLLNKKGSDLMITLSKDGKDEEMLGALFGWVKECCTMHETNR